MTNTEQETRPGIWELVEGGDWACENCEPEGLATVCRALAHRLPGELASRARHIAAITDEGMLEASAEWMRLVTMLAQRQGGPASYRI